MTPALLSAHDPHFIKRVAADDGFQRAAAGVLVALIVAVAKEAIFARK